MYQKTWSKHLGRTIWLESDVDYYTHDDKLSLRNDNNKIRQMIKTKGTKRHKYYESLKFVFENYTENENIMEYIKSNNKSNDIDILNNILKYVKNKNIYSTLCRNQITKYLPDFIIGKKLIISTFINNDISNNNIDYISYNNDPLINEYQLYNNLDKLKNKKKYDLIFLDMCINVMSNSELNIILEKIYHLLVKNGSLVISGHLLQNTYKKEESFIIDIFYLFHNIIKDNNINKRASLNLKTHNVYNNLIQRFGYTLMQKDFDTDKNILNNFLSVFNKNKINPLISNKKIIKKIPETKFKIHKTNKILVLTSDTNNKNDPCAKFYNLLYKKESNIGLITCSDKTSVFSYFCASLNLFPVVLDLNLSELYDELLSQYIKQNEVNLIINCKTFNQIDTTKDDINFIVIDRMHPVSTKFEKTIINKLKILFSSIECNLYSDIVMLCQEKKINYLQIEFNKKITNNQLNIIINNLYDIIQNNNI